MKSLFLLFAVVSLSSAAYDKPTTTELSEMKTAIRLKLRENKNSHATALRLAFHDCVGGTCDGCINLDNSANAGLSDIIGWLDEAYVGAYDGVVSRADFWSLAGIVAVEMGIQFANAVCTTTDCMPDANMVFQWGRSDCADSPSTTDAHTFPEPTMTKTEMMTYFSSNFNGMNETEVTALLGAHALGDAQRNQSGYAGVWTSNAGKIFNNQYYTLLIGDGVTYTNRAVSPQAADDKKWQFDLTDSAGDKLGMMLNTDVELVYDIDVNKLTGTSCTLGTDCTVATTYDQVNSYTTDPTTFMDDFRSVYTKMCSMGYTTLEDVA